MNDHDSRIIGPKYKARKDKKVLAEFAESHNECQACGSSLKSLHIHHIIGGRGGRSDESVNLLRLCYDPCHLLADGLDVRGPWKMAPAKLSGSNRSFYRGDLLPKITLGIAIAMKVRANEMDDEGLARLAVLHGRTLPEIETIPPYFQRLWAVHHPGA